MKGYEGSELILKRIRLHIYGIVFHLSGRALLGTGQEAEAGDAVRLAEVDDELVRIGGIVYRLPEGALLQVVHFVGGAVAAAGLFAIGIHYFPMLAGKGFAIFAQDVQFGNGSDVRPVVVRRRVQAEVTARSNHRETYLLPTVAFGERALMHGRLVREAERLSFGAVRLWGLGAEQVEDGLRKAGHFRLLRSLQVEDDDLILALLQPAARHEERLLRTNLPEAAHGVAVHPDHAFAPGLHVEERIARLVQLEGGAVVGRGVQCFARFVLLVGDELVEGREVVDRPIAQLGRVLTVNDLYPIGNALAVVDGLVEVDAPHRLNEDIKLRALGQRLLQGQGKFPLPAVEAAQEFPIGKDLRPVVHLVDMERALRLLA